MLRPNYSVSLAFGLFSLFPLDTTAGEPIGGSLAGTWVVRWEGQPRSDPITHFTIEVTGHVIEVRGDAWKGHGTFEVQQGHFSWTYSDGRKGHTTLWLDGAGALHGQVREAPMDWDFIATRQ